MQLYHIRRPRLSANAEELAATSSKSEQVLNEMSDRLRWIRTYVVNEENGSLGSVCLFEATDEEAIREHGRRIGKTDMEVHPVQDTAIINPDPQPNAAA
ncbi:MAG: DUF4242 domain-containing protein [Pararhodobacter sp.]|nr:DUF4242 domain-containing protein [Pararhodobacter sp.]